MNRILSSSLWILCLALLEPGSALAQGSQQHSVQSAAHAGASIAHGAAASVKFAAAVTAVPLKASGQVGELSGQAGERLWEAAQAPIGTPLPLTEETLFVGLPPDEALR